MDLSRSTDCFVCSPTFLTYILDNLFSFCHKDESVKLGIEHRVAWLEVGGALRLRLEAIKGNTGILEFWKSTVPALGLEPFALSL
jgi:hypothetical protein